MPDSAVSSGAPTFDSFEATALVFSPRAEGDRVEFGDVTAVVPELGER